MADSISTHSTTTVVHPNAVVAPGAQLGVGVRIGPFCTVGPDVRIGDGTELVSHVVVDGHTTIGANAKLFPFCTVGLAPQDWKYKDEPTRCEVGDRVLIREHCTIHRGTVSGRGVTSVGNECMLMAVVHVAHDCILGNNVVVANNAVMGGHVTIDDFAVIGGAAAIHQFVHIGRAAMIGGVTGVPADVIPFGYVFGNRGKLVGLNVVGLRRRGFDKTAIQQFHIAFKALYRNEGVFADRVQEVRTEFGENPLVAEVLAFIDAAGPRGLVQPELQNATFE